MQSKVSHDIIDTLNSLINEHAHIRVILPPHLLRTSEYLGTHLDKREYVYAS